jgi:thiamine transport system substrate-binding protein
MQHFILFLSTVFFVLIFSFFNKQNKSDLAKPTLRVFGYSSFISKFGPGTELKEIFEKTCDCQVDFIEGADSGILLQRIKLEGSTLGADLVIGFDQFDLQKALSEIKWRKLDFSQLELDEVIKPALNNNYFVPFDWGIMAFVGRKDESIAPPKNLSDLLKPQYKRKFALQDPRTSSPGMQFISWVKKSFGDEEYKKFIEQVIDQAHSFSPSWSTSYGLFVKKQVHFVFSYVTSPLYHLLNEKNSNYFAIPFTEKHPVQFEFAGIPADCRNCDKAEQFINLMLSEEGQKIIMNKNYMYPVMKSVRVGTPFEDQENLYKLISFEIPSVNDIEALVKDWSEVRKGNKLAK